VCLARPPCVENVREHGLDCGEPFQVRTFRLIRTSRDPRQSIRPELDFFVREQETTQSVHDERAASAYCKDCFFDMRSHAGR
jgi:hypothetical protein